MWSYLQRKLGIAESLANERVIMSQNEEIQTEVADLETAFTVIATEFTGLAASLAVANARVVELEAAGVAPQTVAQLRLSVDKVQEFANRIVQSIDPGQPTPTTPSPSPAENVETDPTSTEPVPVPAAGESDPVVTEVPEPAEPGPSIEELSPGTTEPDEGTKPSL